MGYESAIDTHFLGICNRADFNSQTNDWNLIGLSYLVTPFIFPFSLSHTHFGFNLRTENLERTRNFEIRDEDDRFIGDFSIHLGQSGPLDETERLLDQGGKVIVRTDTEWTSIFLPLQGVTLSRAGLHTLFIKENDKKTQIGNFRCIPLQVRRMDKEMADAIRSTPNASRFVQIEIGCKKCSAKQRTYAAIEPIQKMEKDGWTWYHDVQEQFVCDCGSSTVDLMPLKNNLHVYLGRNVAAEATLSLSPLYEQSALVTVRAKLKKILDLKTDEEPIQKFFSENPILFHQFSPIRIIPKPKILTSYIADFGIINAQKELILVEIEKATTRLLTAKGNHAAPLTHAIGQVMDWLNVIREHRITVLNELDIDTNEINKIRGVAIVGRELGYEAQMVRKLKMSFGGEVDLLTYDDILGSMDAIIESFVKL